MSIAISREISDLKAEFEGGTSFSVDWYGLIRRGGENLLDNINPETLKRTVPIYGGLTRNLQVYYCPADVEVPERLYTLDQTVGLDYVPPAEFWRKTGIQRVFTIEYVNGARFIVVRYPVSGTLITVDPMDGTTTNTLSGVSLSSNTFNVLPGARASMQGTFSDVAYTVTITLASPIDISGLLNGVLILPLYLDTAANLSQVEAQLVSSTGNYYDLISTQDSVGDYLADGQNMVRFWLAHATKTGTPDPTHITSVVLKVPMKAGISQTVILGKITVQASNLFFLRYYSNRLFIDGTSGAWKDTPAKGDLINLNRDAAGILHYETALLVDQAASNNRANQGEAQSFTTQLSRKYQAYFKDHPSSAQPPSYSIMPDISHHPNAFYGGFVDDLEDQIGSSADADLNGPVNFADNETPSGTFNGTNATFTLAHTPSPAASMILVLNGQVLAYNSDYTITGNHITFTSPPSAGYAGLPFTASYRYVV